MSSIYIGIGLGAAIVLLEAMPDVLGKWRKYRRYKEMTKLLRQKDRK